MKKSTKNLIAFIKLILVISLVTYVCLRIQWQDSLIIKDATSEVVHKGTIIGQWNEYPVDFLKSDGQTITISTVEQSSSHQISPGFFTYLTQAEPGWLMLGCLAFLSVIIFGAFRWHWLVNTQQLSLNISQAIRLTWIGIFFNNFVPGQTGGDLVKAYYIAKNSPQKRLIAILTVVADRILGLSALIIVSLITVTLFFDRFKQIAIMLWAGLILGLLVATVLFSRKIRRALGLSTLVKKLPKILIDFIYQLDTAIQQYRDHKSGIALWWGLSIANHIVNMLGMYALSKSINMGVPIIEFFALVPVIFIVSAIPIAPNGWGIGEALFGNLFGQYGAAYLPGSVNAQQIMNTRGVALSILFRILSMCLSLVGGLFLLFSKEKIPTATSTLDQQKTE